MDILIEKTTIRLNTRASKVLAEATVSGIISVEDITKMVPSALANHKDEFRETIHGLIGFLNAMGIFVVSQETKIWIYKTMAKEERRKSKIGKGPTRDHLNYIQKLYEWDIKKFELLDEREVRSLGKQVRELDSDKCRNEIVVHNLRLVSSIANKYSRSNTGVTLEHLDLIQEGNIGLIVAAKKFDYRKANQFSTCAYWWITQAITRACDDYSDIIRKPVYERTWVRKVSRISGELLSKLNRIPTPEEIAMSLNAPLLRVKKALLQMQQKVVSLDAPIYSNGEGDWIPLKDILSLNLIAIDDKNETPQDILEQEEVLREACYRIRSVIVKLEGLGDVSKRSKTIFRMRYGLDGSYNSKTLNEVGKVFNLSRERIRQIVEKVWISLIGVGLKRNRLEAVLTEDGLECLLRLKEKTGEELLMLQ